MSDEVACLLQVYQPESYPAYIIIPVQMADRINNICIYVFVAFCIGMNRLYVFFFTLTSRTESIYT